VEYYDRIKFILDKIITISLTLNNKTLTEEEKTRISQEREKWRTLDKIEFVKHFKNGISMEEDFEDFKPKKGKLLDLIDQYIKHLIGK